MESEEHLTQQTEGSWAISLLQRNGLDVIGEVAPPSWSQGRLKIFKIRDGLYVVKTLPKPNPLLALSAELRNDLFDALHKYTSSILLPIRLKGEYIHEHVSEAGSQTAMVFPWIGPVDAYPKWQIDIDDHLSFLAKLTHELGLLNGELVEALKMPGFKIHFTEEDFKKKLATCHPYLGDRACSECLELLARRTDSWDSDCYRQLSHTDLHGSNLVESSSGNLVAVDIDLVRMGNPYVDFVYLVAHHGVSQSALDNLLRRYQRLISAPVPPLNTNTQLLGIHVALGWLYAIVTQVEEPLESTLEVGEFPLDTKSLDHQYGHLRDRNRHLHKALTVAVPRFCRGLHTVSKFHPKD